MIANSSNQLSSSAGSSLEVDGILYQSLFSSVAYTTASAQNHEHILPAEEVKNDGDNKRANKREERREAKKFFNTKGLGKTGAKASKGKNVKGPEPLVAGDPCQDELKRAASALPPGTMFKVPLIKLHRITDFTTPPICRTQKKTSGEEGAVESPFMARSKTEEVGKSSAKSDVITSTPADVNRLKAVLKNGRTWSMPSTPTLEHMISPVPKESYLVALSNSSNFESPMSFKSKSNLHSNDEDQVEPSVESRYETCNSEIDSKSSEISPVVAPATNGAISSCRLREEKYRDSQSRVKSFYNSSLELESGPFKGVVIPSRDRTKAKKDNFVHAESSVLEASMELSSLIGSRNIGTARTLKNKVTTRMQKNNCISVRRKKKGAPIEIRNELESSADVSILERPLAHMYKRNIPSLSKSKLSLRKKTRQLGSKLSLKKSWAEPSPVLTRLRQKAPRQTKTYDISVDDLVADQENTKNTSINQQSEVEKSVVIGRRKWISKKRGHRSHIRAETSDSETSLVIPRRPPNKLSLQEKVKHITSLRPRNRNCHAEPAESTSQSILDVDSSSVIVSGNSKAKRRSGRLAAMKRQSLVPSPKVLRRKSARLCKKQLEENTTIFQREDENSTNASILQNQTHLTELSLKNISKMSVKSVQGLEATALSFGSVNTTVFTDFQTRKERRGNQLVYCKLESSEDMFETSDAHSSEVDKEEPVGSEELPDITKDLENTENTSSDEKESIESEEQMPPPGGTKPYVLAESSIKENSLLELEELEDVCRSVKVQCMVPMKGGKGWRRSCLSMAGAKVNCLLFCFGSFQVQNVH